MFRVVIRSNMVLKFWGVFTDRIFARRPEQMTLTGLRYQGPVFSTTVSNRKFKSYSPM